MFKGWQLWAAGAVAAIVLGLVGKAALDWHNVNEDLKQTRITLSLKEQALGDALKANATNVATIDAMTKAKALDSAALVVIQKNVAAIASRTTEGRTIIREVVANDPAGIDWAKCPVPKRVLDTLNTPG